jgi:hypothetical protein
VNRWSEADDWDGPVIGQDPERYAERQQQRRRQSGPRPPIRGREITASVTVMVPGRGAVIYEMSPASALRVQGFVRWLIRQQEAS